MRRSLRRICSQTSMPVAFGIRLSKTIASNLWDAGRAITETVSARRTRVVNICDEKRSCLGYNSYRMRFLLQEVGPEGVVSIAIFLAVVIGLVIAIIIAIAYRIKKR